MNTKNDTNSAALTSTVKVITDAREEEILSLYRTLHGKVLTCLTDVGIKPTFNDDFSKCGAEDYKNLHHQSRTLLSAKRKDSTDKRIAGMRLAIQHTVDTHIVAARAAKAQIDALPAEVRKFMPAFPTNVKLALSDIRACFPKDATDAQVFGDLTYMGYKVTDLTDKGVVIVPFVAEEPKSEEAAPASGETAKAA